MQKDTGDIIVFLVIVSAVIIAMVAFIVTMLLMYSKRQNRFVQQLEQIKLDHERTILGAKLEIQEQTFQHISREIHDNISLSLTLAKLQLNTIDWSDREASANNVNFSIELLSKSISEMSFISKGLNADMLIQQGLLKAIDEEMGRIRQTGMFQLDFASTGNPVYMENQQELIIFRIVQEAFNNIIKHAGANRASLLLHYNERKLIITIHDNGVGFDPGLSRLNRQAGLKNMETRTAMLGGEMKLHSQPGQGTVLTFIIPFKNL